MRISGVGVFIATQIPANDSGLELKRPDMRTQFGWLAFQYHPGREVL
jgi:hypothetical protein